MTTLSWGNRLVAPIIGLFIDVISTGPDDHRIVALPTMSGRSA
jgi:hypothetical protein